MEFVTAISEYELERGKPVPSKNHAKLQSRIAKAIADRYDVYTEISLDLSRPLFLILHCSQQNHPIG